MRQYVVDHAPFMVAVVDEDRYETLRSHWLEDTDPQVQQWCNYLVQSCFNEEHSERFEAADWFHGGGMYTTGQIFRTCPGPEITHNCRADRATDQVNIPVQERRDGADESYRRGTAPSS